MARLTIDSLKDVREALYDARNSWYDIGVELRVSPTTLDNIKTQSDNNSECLREMLKVWLKGLDCGWKDIVAALNSKSLREITGALVTEIEKDYCTEAAVEQDALTTAGNIKEGMVADLQAELRKLKSEVSVLKTQQKLDQSDFSSVKEPNSKRGIDVSAKGSFLITSDKAHMFELKHFGLRVHVPEDALPPGVTETTVNVQASLSGQYCVPDDSELASAVYWFSAPVKFSRPVTVEIQHNAAFEDPSSKLCFTICKCPKGAEPQLPYTFEKLERGVFSHSSRNGSIPVSEFSGLGIIMPKGGRQHYLSQLWYAKKSERDWSVYYVITKDLGAFKSAVEACYSDEACQGNCARIDFEENQIMMDIPMEGIRTEGWKITPLYSPVIQKEDSNSFSCGRLPVCELAVMWEGNHYEMSERQYYNEMCEGEYHEIPARFTFAINLLGAKAPGSVVLDITKSAFESHSFKLFYNTLDDFNCDVHWTSRMFTEEKYIKRLGCLEGPEMEVFFQSEIITLEIPAAVSGWRIISEVPKLQVSRGQTTSSVQFRVKRDANMQEPLSMDVLLKGARPPNNVIKIFLDPSVWGAQKSAAISFQQQRIRAEERREEEQREAKKRRKEEEREERRQGKKRHEERWLYLSHPGTSYPPVKFLPEKQSSTVQSPSVTTLPILPIPSGKRSTSNLQGSKKWYELGIQLDINHGDLDAIGKASTDDEEKLICVLFKWIHNDESQDLEV